MNVVPLREVIISSASGIVLWFLSWLAVVLPMSHRVTVHRLLTMPLSFVLFGILLFIVGCAALVALYRLVGCLRLRSRRLGELLFVLFPGFVMVVLLAAHNPLHSLLFGWVFFSFPACCTILSLHALQCYQRRKIY